MNKTEDTTDRSEASSPDADAESNAIDQAAKSGSGWKKFLSIALRLVIAAAGLSYVGYSLNFYDYVRLPVGYISEQQTEPVDVRTVSSTDTHVIVEMEDGSTQELAWADFTNTEEGLWYRPGLKVTLKKANPWLLLSAVLIMALIFPIQALRWMWLMRCRGLSAPYFRTFRINMVGAFYNSFMMGSTGGDVIKAYYAARGRSDKTTAVMSVVVDRAIGLVALLLLGALAGISILTAGTENVEGAKVTYSVWGLVGCFILGSLVYFSTRIRRILGIEWLLQRIPGKAFFNKVDQAAVAYKGHVPTLGAGLGVSIPTHFIIMTSSILTLWAVTPPGVPRADFFNLLSIFPVIFLVGAIPITLMGFGVMEPVGIALLSGLAGSNEVFMTLVLVRLYQVGWASTGAIFLIRGDLVFNDDQAAKPDEPVTTVTH